MKSIVEKRFNLSKKYIFKMNQIDENLYSINLARFFGDRTITGNLILDTSKTTVWILISEENDKFINLVVKRFFEKLYPKISNI